MLRHVAERDPRRGDAGLEPLGEQLERLIDQGGDGVQAGDNVFVIAHLPGWSAGQELSHVLLRPVELCDREILVRELVEQASLT